MLAAHSDLLIIEFIRAVGQEIAILGLIGLLLSAPFLIKAAGLGDKTTDSLAALASIVIVAALLLVVVFYGIYDNRRRVNLCLRARKKTSREAD